MPIVVKPYDAMWPEQFDHEETILREILGNSCLQIHHIGSTSVPHLAAKEDLDICCVVSDLQDALPLQERGYVFKGEFNIPLRYFFSKNTPQSKVNLHVVEDNHGFIDLQLRFRNYLRDHPLDRKAYQDLKFKILSDPSHDLKEKGMMSNYTLQKNAFIKSILLKSGFSKPMLNFCLHDTEWQAYESLIKSHDGTLTKSEGDFHFVLYHGVEITGAATVFFKSSGPIIEIYANPLDTKILQEQLGLWIQKRLQIG